MSALYHHVYFVGFMLKDFVRALFRRGYPHEKQFALASIILLSSLFFLSRPAVALFLSMPSAAVTLTNGVILLDKYLWFHQLYFCCGPGAPDSI